MTTHCRVQNMQNYHSPFWNIRYGRKSKLHMSTSPATKVTTYQDNSGIFLLCNIIYHAVFITWKLKTGFWTQKSGYLTQYICSNIEPDMLAIKDFKDVSSSHNTVLHEPGIAHQIIMDKIKLSDYTASILVLFNSSTNNR